MTVWNQCQRCGSQLHDACGAGEGELTPAELEVIRLRTIAFEALELLSRPPEDFGDRRRATDALVERIRGALK